MAFRVHAPCSGAFLLDVFANAVTPKEYLTGEPMKFKSVCKFKIVCEDLQTVMVPLPNCASGEWGPTKATRLFGLVPITHQVRFFVAIFSFGIGKCGGKRKGIERFGLCLVMRYVKFMSGLFYIRTLHFEAFFCIFFLFRGD